MINGFELTSRPDMVYHEGMKQMFCIACGDKLEQKANGRPRLTCDDRCRQQAQRARNRDRFRRRRRDARNVAEGRALLAYYTRRYKELDEQVAFRLSHQMPFFVCPECGEPYLKLTWGGSAPRTCSERCSRIRRDKVALAKRAMIRAEETGETWKVGWISGIIERRVAFDVCEHCHDPFIQTRRRGPKRRFCSARCRWRAWKARRRICPVCGTLFDPRDKSGHVRRKYCNDRCTARARQWRRLDRLGAKPRDGCWHYGYGRGAPRTLKAMGKPPMIPPGNARDWVIPEI
jgi:hypothetical protein